MKVCFAFALAVLCALHSPAAAEPGLLRIATAAPDGTAWARLFRAMGRDIEADSRGAITTKWYFGGIAGSELESLERLRKNQLDAVMSGGPLCMKLSPSLRALRLIGLYESRAEASYVLGRLRPTIEREISDAGFHNIGVAMLGPDMLFTRAPITSVEELRKTRLWVWDVDPAMLAQFAAIGVPTAAMGVERAGRAYEERQVDGFLSVPTAALAFQWSAATKELEELRLGYLPGCMVMTQRAWDTLDVGERAAINESVGKFLARLEDLGRRQDAELLGGLFERQGLTRVAISPAFATAFLALAKVARESLRDKLLPGELMDRVAKWVGDYRAEHAVPRN
ncbi:MAG TPA: TRAP transporter substrate-binding protein DctP [Polyangia bacterium]|nr:TRAP transporter substrate-binding protein DctP [Polyangia bacterium]